MSCPSNTKAVLTLTALAVTLSGCSTLYFDRRETVVPYAGDAKAVNQVTMMVDPWPPYSRNRNIAFNGERMQGAVERYRTRNVIRPVSALTSCWTSPTSRRVPRSKSRTMRPRRFRMVHAVHNRAVSFFAK